MNWFLKTLGQAVLMGVGIKLGGDAYEAIKGKLKEMAGPNAEDDDGDTVDAAVATAVEDADSGAEPAAAAAIAGQRDEEGRP